AAGPDRRARGDRRRRRVALLARRLLRHRGDPGGRRRMARRMTGGGKLRRQLHLPEAVAMSVGVMAPTLAMSVTGVAAAQQLGRAAPLAFIIAGAAVGLVAFGFVRLSAEIAHAG